MKNRWGAAVLSILVAPGSVAVATDPQAALVKSPTYNGDFESNKSELHGTAPYLACTDQNVLAPKIDCR
jgi:hypothetical protein